MIRSFFLLVLLSNPAFGALTRVHSFTPTFVKFTDGQVGFWTKNAGFILAGQSVQVEMNDKNEIISITAVFEKNERPPFVARVSEANVQFIPSILPTYAAATRLLESFSNADVSGSQCYDRAHIWAYSAGKNSFHLEKTWLFFADHFIQKNHFKWWFHVAPVASVKMQGLIQQRIMDRKFSEFPLKIKLWTDLFMVEKQTCKEIERYTDYSEHPGEDDCYLVTSTPYYWQPKDLEAFSKEGTDRTGWIDWEVRHAFKHAFGISK